MRIIDIHAREIRMRLITPFETSFGVTQDRRIVLLEVHTDEGTGWGELTAAESPSYNSEFTDTAWLVLKNFLAPLVVKRSFDHPDEVRALMEPVRGHEMAKASIEMASWDAFARAKGSSLASMLGATRTEIDCGVSLGIHPTTDALVERVSQELAAGYHRVKLKIKPGKDVAYVKAVRERYPEIDLTVDANSAYTLDDVDRLIELDQFKLCYIEQPLQWNEIYEHAQLQRSLETPICLDECIHNLRDARTAVRLGACKVVNIKVGRVGGHSEAKLIQDFCLQEGVPVWCGGMLEAGIGRAHNIAISALPGFVYPGDVSASKRYWAQDIVEPAAETSAKGTISVPTDPGIGFKIDLERIQKLTVVDEIWES